MFSRYFQCDRCGSMQAFRSRPRSFAEKFLLPVFLFRTVRCGGCYRRFYRPLFVPARKRDSSELVTPVADQFLDVLHPPVSGPYTEKNPSGSNLGSAARAEEVRLQQ